MPQDRKSLGESVLENSTSLREFAVGDPRREWKNPAKILEGVQLDRIECVEWLATAACLARESTVVSAGFAGRTLCGFPIDST
jgi:hypothetical protein